MKLTVSQQRALTILRDHGPLRPREFAKHMWPDSTGWHRSAKCGPNGSHRGGGMYRAGGAYLGKLRARGWVWWAPLPSTAHVLTADGRRALEQT